MKPWKVAAVVTGCAWSSIVGLILWAIWADNDPDLMSNLLQTGYVLFFVALALSGLTEWLRSEDE